MSIQQDINSSLGQLGVLVALNPTLQERAKEEEGVRKINRDEKKVDKQFKAAKKDFFKKSKEQIKAEEANLKEGNSEALRSPKLYADRTRALENIRDLVVKNKKLAEEKFDIVPSKENYDNLTIAQESFEEWKDKPELLAGKPITKEGKEALKALQRAEERRVNKQINTERRTKLLYGEMERMMPGFKYMEPKKQNDILYKKMDYKERKRIKDEAERREKYYGK